MLLINPLSENETVEKFNTEKHVKFIKTSAFLADILSLQYVKIFALLQILTSTTTNYKL